MLEILFIKGYVFKEIFQRDFMTSFDSRDINFEGSLQEFINYCLKVSTIIIFDQWKVREDFCFEKPKEKIQNKNTITFQKK